MNTIKELHERASELKKEIKSLENFILTLDMQDTTHKIFWYGFGVIKKKTSYFFKVFSKNGISKGVDVEIPESIRIDIQVLAMKTIEWKKKELETLYKQESK